MYWEQEQELIWEKLTLILGTFLGTFSILAIFRELNCTSLICAKNVCGVLITTHKNE